MILIAAGETHVADPLDTVHHEMDSVIVSHHGYKSVWSPVLEQPFLLTNPQLNPHDESVVVVIKDAQTVSHILIFHGSIGILHRGTIVCRISRRKENT